MTHRQHRGILGGIAAALAVSVAADAFACSCITPGPEFYLAEGELPENADGFVFWLPEPSIEYDLVVERWDGADWQPEPVTVTGANDLQEVAIDPFDEGDRFRVSFGTDGVPTLVGDVTVGPPASLSGLSVDIGEQSETTAWINDGSSGGSCGTRVEAVERQLTVNLPAELEPYRHALHYTTFVDGLRWAPSAGLCQRPAPGRTWDGVGSDRLLAGCKAVSGSLMEEPTRLEGEHTATVLVKLPGTDLRWESDPAPFELDCRGVGGGCSTTGGSAPQAPVWLVVLALFFAAGRRQR